MHDEVSSALFDHPAHAVNTGLVKIKKLVKIWSRTSYSFPLQTGYAH